MEPQVCDYTTDEKYTHYVISMITSSLSILGSIWTIIAFFVFQAEHPFMIKAAKKEIPSPSSNNASFSDLSLLSQSSKTSRGKHRPTLVTLILCLAFSDLALSILVLTENLLLLKFPSVMRQNDTCHIWRVLYEFFAVCSFVWTSNIAFTVFRMLVKNQDFQYRKVRQWSTIIINNLTGWGIPFAFACIMYFRPESVEVTAFGSCVPTSIYRWSLWFAPLLISVLWNLLFYSFFLYQVKMVFGLFASEYSVIIRIQRRLSIYLLLFVLCWVWDVIIHFMKVFGVCVPFWFETFQIFFSPLQGFLNFIVYTKSYMIKYRNPFKQEYTEVADPTKSLSEEDAFLNQIQNNINSYYYQSAKLPYH